MIRMTLNKITAVLKVTATIEIYDDEASEETVRYIIEQDLEDDGFDVDVALLKDQEWHMLAEDDDGIIHGLPVYDDQYIMTNGKDVWMDGYVDGIADGIILDSGRDIREITAWMYTPELPKKG